MSSRKKTSQKTSAESSGSAPAKILYRPVGIANSLVSGALAGLVFKQLWKRISPQKSEDAPKALESQFSLSEVLIASALQGAIFALTKALVDRAGARAFQRVMGEWPGD